MFPLSKNKSTFVDNPDLNSYELGDSFRVNIPEIAIFNEYKRVYKRALSIDTNSLAIVTITVR